MLENRKTIEFPFYKELGKALGNIRNEKGIPLEKVAKELKVSKSTIDNWELGKTRISTIKYKKLCELYGINPNSEIIVSVNFWRTEL